MRAASRPTRWSFTSRHPRAYFRGSTSSRSTSFSSTSSHSFPQVFIEWFYTASALKVGGHLLVDDVHVWTGHVLRDFLLDEPEWTKID
jgi:hypothetical protein